MSTGAAADCGSPSVAADAPSSDVVATPAPLPGERNLVAEVYAGRYRTRATVLEDTQHGPQLCYFVADSLPPQGGGPDVLGWDWGAVPAESVRGTSWGFYELVGTYADGAFTLMEPATAADPRAGQASTPSKENRFATPCDEPAAGWVPADPARAIEEALQEARKVATGSPGFAGLWIDQRVPAAELTEENGNEPQRYVLNVSTTGDVGELDAALRRVWGGSLCVSTAARSKADLRAVQAALLDLPGWFASWPDFFTGTVNVSVVHGTLEQQQALDEQFGAGAVRLSSQLKPID